MGAPKTKWSDEEETALRDGVAKYGTGKWRGIQKDPTYGPILKDRSNVDLKVGPPHSPALSVLPAVKSTWWAGSNRARAAPRSRSYPTLYKPVPPALYPCGTSCRPLGFSAQDKWRNMAVGNTAADKPKKESEKAPKEPAAKKAAFNMEAKVVAAIGALKDGKDGSSFVDIVKWIEDKGGAPDDLEKNLQPKVKAMVADGKLKEVKKGSYVVGESKRGGKASTKGNKDAKKAAVAASAEAARAVAEAEAAARAAELAAREAERAELEAIAAEEAAKVAATKPIKKR
mmetsp:Transcript_26554/g.85141  ORF Transcript_26554/g.85141 Transcript_26554/m.85141 type:complete len:286 (+) Transcript_26554:1081-1938(+)